MSENQRGKSCYRKRKTSYCSFDHRRRKFDHVLEAGLKGFICTCNFNEKQCIREAYNILNEYSEQHETKEEPSLHDKLDEEEDVTKALEKEVNALQEESSRGSKFRKFQIVETGFNNCLFIRTTVPDPVELVVRILEDIEIKKKQKTRFLLRMLPIETTCKVNIKKMEEAFKPLVEKYFSSEGKTFSIIYRVRCNSSSSRDEVIESFASLVKAAHPDNRADLNNPQLAVLVEIIKGICCIGVVPRFTELRKYNLLELASPSTKQKAGDDSEGPVSVVVKEVGDDSEGPVSVVDKEVEDDSEGPVSVVVKEIGDDSEGPVSVVDKEAGDDCEGPVSVVNKEAGDDCEGPVSVVDKEAGDDCEGPVSVVDKEAGDDCEGPVSVVDKEAGDDCEGPVSVVDKEAEVCKGT